LKSKTKQSQTIGNYIYIFWKWYVTQRDKHRNCSRGPSQLQSSLARIQTRTTVLLYSEMFKALSSIRQLGQAPRQVPARTDTVHRCQWSSSEPPPGGPRTCGAVHRRCCSGRPPLRSWDSVSLSCAACVGKNWNRKLKLSCGDKVFSGCTGIRIHRVRMGNL
jgi:hypothetical protein